MGKKPGRGGKALSRRPVCGLIECRFRLSLVARAKIDHDLNHAGEKQKVERDEERHCQSAARISGEWGVIRV
jgi:hypothetical protein